MHAQQPTYVTLDLSAGGMARLQLALELGPLEENYVVLKWLDAESTRGDANARRRFLEEARLTQQLTHTHIVAVRRVFEEEGRYCIVMEWIRGMSLRQVLEHPGHAPLPPRVAARVVHELCLALHHAWHARNESTGQPLHVVHCDLKPENVMLTLVGSTKVIDFGIAKASSQLTPAGLHTTPQYASPERAGEILAAYNRLQSPREDDAPLDGRSDLFCAGLILHELLTGRPVFPPLRAASEEAGLELLSTVHQGPVTLEELPEALEPIVRRALAYPRHQRYETGQDMARALENAGLATEQEVADYLKGLFPDARDRVREKEEELQARKREQEEAHPTGPTAVQEPAPEAPPQVEPPRRHAHAVWVMAAAALVLLVAGIGTALWYGAQKRPSVTNSTLSLVPREPIPESATFSLLVYVRNAEDQPIAGEPVRFEATDRSGSKVKLPRVVTDEQGKVEAQLGWQRPEVVSVVPVIGEGPHPVRLGAATAIFQALLPDVSQSQLVATSPVTAGKRVALSATVRDVHGHLVADNPVRFALEGLEPLTGEAPTNANGQATFSFEPHLAGNYTAKAFIETSRGWTELPPETVRLTAGIPLLEKVSLEVDPPMARADETTPIRLTARVRDAYGNSVDQHPITLRVSGEDNQLRQPEVTGPDGTGKAELRSGRAGPRQVCLHVQGLTTEHCEKASFTAGPPSPKGLRLVPPPNPVRADGTSAAVFAVAVQDARGNPLAGVPVLLSVSGVGSLDARKEQTDGEGRAYVRVRSKQTGWSKVTMRLEKPPLTKSERVQFVAGLPNGQGSTLRVSPKEVPADGSTSLEVTVQVRDTEGNPVVERYVLIRLLGVGTEQQRRPGPTNANGETSTQFTSLIAGEGTIVAELESSSQKDTPIVISAQETVHFTPGKPESLTLTSTSLRGQVGQPLQLTVKALDKNHNPLSGRQVHWAIEGSSESFTQPSDSKLDEEGQATVTVTPSRQGNVTFVAKVGDQERPLNVGIDSGPPQEVHLEVESGTATLRADGTDRVQLVLRLLDAQGNAVGGQSVSWEGVEEEDVLARKSNTTDATGRIRATFTTRKPGQRTVKAVVTGTKLEDSLVLKADSPVEHTVPMDAGQPSVTGASPSIQSVATEPTALDGGTSEEPRAPAPIEEAPEKDGGSVAGEEH